MLDHLTPSLIVIGYVAAALAVYYFCNRSAFKGHARFQGIDQAQQQRFACFEDAASITQLQIDTNEWHEKAILAKTHYELAGVAACSGAPALIFLSAIEPLLHHAHVSSAMGFAIAHAFVACTVLLIIWKWRYPSKPHVDSRLRSEALRLHLHCLLAGVGPYASAQSTRVLTGESVAQQDADAVTDELLRCERECLDQAEHPAKIVSFSSFDKRHAEVYLLERIGEQEKFFHFAESRQRRAYERSARAVFALVATAAIAGIVGIFASDPPISEWLRAIFLVAGSTVVLLVSLRAVFGWDSKAALYVRHERFLSDLLRQLRTQKDAISPDAPESAKTFRRTAAHFEALMAREACDWRLISDREVYDITI